MDLRKKNNNTQSETKTPERLNEINPLCLCTATTVDRVSDAGALSKELQLSKRRCLTSSRPEAALQGQALVTTPASPHDGGNVD